MSVNIIATAAAVRSASRNIPLQPTALPPAAFPPVVRRRHFSSSVTMDAKFAPAKRVADQKQDVWSIVNEAAAASPKQPIGNAIPSIPSPELMRWQ